MFNKKKLTNLSKDDLAELTKRIQLINEHILIAQALDLQKRFWLNSCLEKLGLDIKKQYSIDFKDGAITEAEPKVEAKEESKDEPDGDKKVS